MNINMLVIQLGDDNKLADRGFFKSCDARITICRSVIEGIYRIVRQSFDLIVLDAGTITLDGMTLVTKIESITTKPILFFSNHLGDTDRARLLIAGADEAFIHSDTAQEIKHRISLHLCKKKHTAQIPKHKIMYVNDLSLCLNRREVKKQDQLLTLTGLEFEFLYLLVSNVGTIIKRSFIIDCLFDHKSSNKNLNMHISNIRKKLAIFNVNSEIKTVRGIGYVLL